MPKLRVHNFSISLDGHAAGPDQGPDHPLGVGGDGLHRWALATRTFRQTFGDEGTEAPDGPGESIDDRFAAQGDVGIGATVMGRNMFGPIRGSWDDEQWRGWGATTRRTTRSTSSPTASRLLSSRRWRRQTARTCGWAAARPPSSSTSEPA